MSPRLAAALDVARQLAAAAPAAWRGDRVFRWAAMGTGLTLGALLLGATEGPRPPLTFPGPQRAVQAGRASVPALPSPAAPQPPQRPSGGAGGQSQPGNAAPAQPVAIAPGRLPGAPFRAQ